ncbi:S-layer homology domain-containing protein [Paenibacillus alginolyticus]|uniref:S-layer homology domain-containing protein n=1 Tax=Paenibacillus alginolyticus TaxID=59839 RepID=A0ABT4G599_9BACL|nr:S-layer homology domain-containing protein [Paenibacillus alginolyticus]MCY9669256.1 S-layer homology domain-containing protein [Paenibacillus alginolyticus]MCY9691342.1 S-layer homology domain-containing protein [Paenibacillus alginolyticus]MEC0146452.1 S-layer homology domain-containing protein [Paenibacillus alginolyticus]
MKKSSFFSFAVSLIIASSALIPSASVDGGNSEKLRDIQGHWAEVQIKAAVTAGYVDGYQDGTFKPDAEVTRAEFMKLLVGALKLKTTAAIASWYQPYVDAAKQAGIYVEDFSTDSWNNAIPRKEMSLLAVRAGITGYKQDYDINRNLYEAAKAGIITGTAPGELSPDGVTTRAQAIVVIERVLAIKAGKNHDEGYACTDQNDDHGGKHGENAKDRNGDPPNVKYSMFDDFSYMSSNDPKIALNDWEIRSSSGDPGPAGATWSANNISFVTDPTNVCNKFLRLISTTDGTGTGTSQAEIYSSKKFREGTYAARIKFTDAPISGSDGDGIVETFFAISDLRYDNDPLYSELDYEYLANGGWGVTQPAMWNTSWYTYSNNPLSQDNVHNAHPGIYRGWHTLVMAISSGEIKYYLDGKLMSTHGGKYYPRTDMSINFNLWFMPEALMGSSDTRTYQMDVDWVYHAKTTVLTPAQVDSIVQNYRSKSIRQVDNIR